MKRSDIITKIVPAVAVFALCALFLPFVSACSDDNNDYSEMPAKIQSFVSEYFPETGVTDYSFSDNTYHVTLDQSAYLEFNAIPAWTLIDGRGSPLPEMLIYDQLPQSLYSYLETIGVADGVYSLNRNKETIKAGLLDSTVTYDIATGKIK